MKLGKNFLLGIVDEASGAFMPLAFAQSCSYNVTNKLVEVSSPLVGGYDNYRKKTTGWTMKHEGLIGDATLRYSYKGVQYDFISLISTFVKSGEPMLCRWHENDEIKQGLAIVKSVDEVGSVKALAKVSVSLQGTGELKDLDPNHLEGTFAYVISSRSLLLYAISRPIAGFTPFVGTVPATTTWDPVESSRVQQFEPDDDLSFNVADTVTAVRGTTAQPGVSFVNSTTLHVVLLQTDTRDEQQQLHRYVQPLWWGGYALGDMEVKNAGNVTLLTLPTTGAISSIEPVEVNPSIDVLSPGALHIDITGTTGQAAHCCDRTASLDKTLTYYQTSNNIPGVDPYMIMGPGKEFRCNFRLWGNDNEGNELFSFNQGTLIPITNITEPVPAVANLHFQLEGLGVDESGPWHVTNVLTSLLDQYDLYYAYNATAQKLTLFSPNVSERLIQGVLLDGSASGTGSVDRFYDIDSEGGRVPVTYSGIPSFTTIAPMFGNGTMHDVSSLTMVALMAQPLPAAFTLDKLPLADIVLYAADETTELARIPMLTEPGTAVASVPEVTDYVFAYMADGATQSLTTRQYRRDVTVSTSVEQTGSTQWTVTAHLKATGTASPATLPGDLTMQWLGGATLVIPAGQSSATGTLAVNPSFLRADASLDFWASDSFFIVCAHTVDMTPDNWKCCALGTLNGQDLYDVFYTADAPVNIGLWSDAFPSGTYIPSNNGGIANHLMKVTHGATPTMAVACLAGVVGEAFTMTFAQGQIVTDGPVVLYYRWTTYSTVKLSDKIGAVSYSRRTNIGEALPYVRARTTSMSAMYAPVLLTPLAKLGDEGHIDEVVRVNVPQEYDDSTGIVEFCSSPMWGGNAINATGITGIQIYGVTGTQIFPRS